MQDKTNPFAFYAGLHLLFAFYANIVKGECRDKRELYFRLDYAETNPTLYKYRYFLGGKPVGLFYLKLLPTIPKISTPKRDKVNKEK